MSTEQSDAQMVADMTARNKEHQPMSRYTPANTVGLERVITKPCIFCNDVAVVYADPDGLRKWRDNTLILDALPDLTVGERELLQTGIHSICWDENFG